ncbi:WD40-repeat-containing domain protein [Chytridium lagenaria]|nr:WD40-repeat-containing domain protein [Chytridium lagenaria]
MDRRKEELEKKRLKLAELRKAREERRVAFGDAPVRETTATEVVNREKQEVDDLISSLVGDRKHDVSSSPILSERIPLFEKSTPERAAPVEKAKEVVSAQDIGERPPLELVAAEFVLLTFSPRFERLFYSKEAQTDAIVEPEKDKEDSETVSILGKKETEQETDETDAADKKEPEAFQTRALSEDEKRVILQSEPFSNFFDYSSKLIERALNEKYDILKDYTVSNDATSDTSNQKGVKYVCNFYDEKLSKNRSVTDVHWSPKYSELLLCSYNKNQVAVNEANGLVLVWNLHLADRPEFVFHSQSDVMTARFSEFHPNLIIGGTYSGQIVLWDTRSKSLPVLKTPLSAVGHTHPVYSMSLVGTQNANNVITASSDGLVCSWTLDMLAQPQEMLDLIDGTHAKTDEVAVTTLAFPANETATFWVGTEESTIFQANRYDRAGSKAGINTQDLYKGHHGMITGLHFHPLSGPVDFSDLFLSSSVDWTVKLWRAKSSSKTSTATSISPLLVPSHPALFASTDGGGRFDLYDLNQEIEVPITSTIVGNGKALNKLDWDKEGKKVAIGSSDAHCYVYDIGEISQPHAESWSQLQRVVGEMTMNQQK